MSFHYEVVFSLDLHDETPPEVLDELRWHLGLSDEQPPNLSYGDLGRLLKPNEFSYLPGGEIVRLERYMKWGTPTGGHYVHGLFVRLYWLDDQFADCWLPVVRFLWQHIETEGYVGFVRTDDDVIPDLLAFRNGHGYLVEPNGVPKPLEKDGPEWPVFNRQGRPE